MNRCRFWSSSLALTLSIWLCLYSIALAQKPTGLRPTPIDQLDTLPTYSPGQVTVEKMVNGNVVKEVKIVTLPPLPSKHDLSNFLPKPGRQIFGDCVGWAVARGAYSYQFGRSRQRKPAEKFDMFSPRFIYSQINQGSDSGSFIFHTTKPNAVDLVLNQGCASQATCPYDASPNGWSNSPSLDAQQEAKNFLAVQHLRLSDLESIKRGITQNVPIVLSIRTDDPFYDDTNTAIYRWSGDPNSGHHAIVAVGYDDSKSAVKLMNSWGDSWKNDGFCWVHYDQFQNMGANHWLRAAHLIRVLNENQPKFAFTSNRSFLLNVDGAIYENGTILTNNDFAKTIAATDDWLYALDQQDRVFAYVLVGGPQGPHNEFHDISSGNAPQGLGGQQVAMLAATTNHLYVLTKSKRVYARIPGTGNQRHWKQLALPNNERAIDLRERQRVIYATSETGNVWKRENGSWAMP